MGEKLSGKRVAILVADGFEQIEPLELAHPEDYDAVLLPGGVTNPDRLRRNYQALAFVRSSFEAGKPVASICRAPWTPIDAGVARGRRLTSHESIPSDLKNAGARWVDRAVVVDDGLVTSRKPADISGVQRKDDRRIRGGPARATTRRLMFNPFQEVE